MHGKGKNSWSNGALEYGRPSGFAFWIADFGKQSMIRQSQRLALFWFQIKSTEYLNFRHFSHLATLGIAAGSCYFS